MIENGAFVVVTTDASRQGVFAGTLADRDGSDVTLTDARMCVFWSAETKGVLGLAANGPQDGSRIGPAVPEIELDCVSAVIRCTRLARARWEAEPWS